MLRKDIKISIALVLAIVATSIIGYVVKTRGSSESVTPVIETVSMEGWATADVGGFTISLPPDWEYRPLQGIDSLVGDFAGDGVTMSFDFGWYSNSLADDTDPAYNVTYEMIDGENAKIVIPKATTDGMMGVYFEGLGNNGMDRLQISGSGLTDEQQEIVLQMFRTIQFAE
jgi:hypothetical protein